MDTPLTPWQWSVEHLKTLGWPVLCYLLLRPIIWLIGRFAKNFVERWETAENHVEKMATNELPHIQAAVETMAEEMKGMREDFRDYFKRDRD